MPEDSIDLVLNSVLVNAHFDHGVLTISVRGRWHDSGIESQTIQLTHDESRAVAAVLSIALTKAV